MCWLWAPPPASTKEPDFSHFYLIAKLTPPSLLVKWFSWLPGSQSSSVSKNLLVNLSVLETTAALPSSPPWKLQPQASSFGIFSPKQHGQGWREEFSQGSALNLGSSFTSAPSGKALNTKYLILNAPSVKWDYSYPQHGNLQQAFNKCWFLILTSSLINPTHFLI